MSQPFDTFNSGVDATSLALANATTDNPTSEDQSVDYWMDMFNSATDDIANNNVAVNDNSAIDVDMSYGSMPTWDNMTMTDPDMPNILPMDDMGTLQSIPTTGDWGLENTAFSTATAWPIVAMNDPVLPNSMPMHDMGMLQSIPTTGDWGLGNTAISTAAAWPNMAMDNTGETVNPSLLMDSSQTVPINMPLPPTTAPTTTAPTTTAPASSAPASSAPARSAMGTDNTSENGFMATWDMFGNAFMATGDVSGNGFTATDNTSGNGFMATNNTFGNGFMATDNMSTNGPMATQNATHVMQPPPVPDYHTSRVRTASDALRAQAAQRAAQRAMRAPRRPPGPRVECNLCDERPDGFRGQHELDRHTKAKHRETVDQYEIVDAGISVTASNQRLTKPIADCKTCRRQKKYNSEQNAVAHLRSRHFAAGQSNGRQGRVNRELPLEDMRPWVKWTVVRAASGAQTTARP